MTNIDVTGLDPAEVLAALYNASQPQGMGFLHFDTARMTAGEARALIGDQDDPYFDYLKGRVMKVRIPTHGGCLLVPHLYDRDNGDGAASRALASLFSEAAS